MPQIFLPSRITGSTKTLIDNIFCNIPQSSEQNISANLTTTYSDHLPQVLLVPGFYWYKNLCKSNVFIRDWKTFNNATFSADYKSTDWKTFNNATFSADYKSTDWPNIMQIDKGNPNLSFHNYIEEVEKMISNHAPLRKTRKRELKLQSKPWISSGLQKFIAITDPRTIAKSFKNFFCSLAAGVQSEVPFSYKTCFEYLPPPNQDSFFISPCTKEEIIEVNSNFKPKKLAGPNSILTKLS